MTLSDSSNIEVQVQIGPHVRKIYLPSEKPCAGHLPPSKAADEMKQRLREPGAILDPLALLNEMRAMQHQVAALVGTIVHVVPHSRDQLGNFFKILAMAWNEGEVRPTHRGGIAMRSRLRTRADPSRKFGITYGNGWKQSRTEPAKDLFRRLQAESPDAIAAEQLRTLQRRVKAWRAEAARYLSLRIRPHPTR